MSAATLNANPIIYASSRDRDIATRPRRSSGNSNAAAGTTDGCDEEQALLNSAQLPFLSSTAVVPSALLLATASPLPSPAASAAREPWDAVEVFDVVREIADPEHPLTLEQLQVVQSSLIDVEDAASHIALRFTPTIPHCSMATLIGLCIRVKLLRALPQRFKVDIRITPGTHSTEDAINKQLNDKERVAAALENRHLLDIVNSCIAGRRPHDATSTAAPG